jgi:hypothetical protein
MAGATIDINGHSFAIELAWQPLSNARPRSELPGLFGSGRETRRVGQEFECDLVSWSVETADIQHGFASSESRLKKTCALAPLLIRTLRQTHGDDARNLILAIPYGGERLYYLAVQNGVILPESDRLLSEDEAQVQVLNEMTTDGWTLIYAPAHWGIADSLDDSLEDLLFSGRKLRAKPARYMYVAPITKNPAQVFIPIVLAAGLGVLGWYGYSYYQDYQFAQQLEAQRMAANAQHAEQAPPPPPPWVSSARAPELWEACLAATRTLPLWPGNWFLENIDCSAGGLTASWRRGENGWISHLQSVVPRIVVSPDGESASLSVPLNHITPAGEGETPPSQSERLITMHSIAQHLDIPINITMVSQPPALPGQEDLRPPPTFHAMRWSVQGSETLLSALIHTIDHDAFRLDRANATITDTGLAWSLEGTQYVQ